MTDRIILFDGAMETELGKFSPEMGGSNCIHTVTSKPAKHEDELFRK